MLGDTGISDISDIGHVAYDDSAQYFYLVIYFIGPNVSICMSFIYILVLIVLINQCITFSALKNQYWWSYSLLKLAPILQIKH